MISLDLSYNYETEEQNYSVNVEVTDDVTGVDPSSLQYLWSLDDDTEAVEDETWYSFEAYDTLETPEGVTGIYWVHISVADYAGNTRTRCYGEYCLDNEVPEVSFSPNSKSSYGLSYSTTVSVTDDGAGVDSDSLQYGWGSSTNQSSVTSWTSFESGDTITTLSNVTGNYYLHVIASDTAGNTVNDYSGVFRLDNESPEVSFSLNTNITYGKSYSTMVSVTDDEVGVDTSSLQYGWGTSTSQSSVTSWDSFTSGDSITTPSNVSGNYYLHIIASDTLGNTTNECSGVFKLDNESPEVSFSPNTNTTYGKTRSIVISVTDDEADVDSTSLEYGWGTSTSQSSVTSWTSFELDDTITTPSSATGDYYLHIIASDNAGNTTNACSGVFKLDNELPEIVDVTISVTSSQLSIESSATDAVSGLHSTSGYRFKINTNSFDSWQSSSSYVYTDVEPNTQYTVWTRVRDQAYNVYTESNVTYSLANTPIISEDIEVSMTDGYEATLNWEANSNPSGTIYELEVSDDGSSGWSNVYTGTDLTYTHQVAFDDTEENIDITKYYRVRAKNSNSIYTAYSDIVNVERTVSHLTTTIDMTDYMPFNLAISGRNLSEVDNLMVEVGYDSSDIEVIDLCGMTFESKMEACTIDELGIRITDFDSEAGRIVYEISKEMTDDDLWNGILNMIEFEALQLGETDVSITFY